MQLQKKIFSLFFLSIFSMLLLHQVLPHVHHEHEGFEDATTNIEDYHHSNDANHHHHGEEEKNEEFDFLGFLFGNHTHSVDVTNLPTVKNVLVQKIVNKSAPAVIPIIFDSCLTIFADDKEPTFSHAPPDLEKSVYLSACSLRGPPYLG